jgi:hypothetical protein
MAERLISADALRSWFESHSVYDEFSVGYIMGLIDEQPTVEPTLYGYKIEHLALIARVMEKDGVTPEIAVQVFKDVQTIVMKIIDEIDGAVKRAFEQAIETGNGESNEQIDK